MKRWIMIEIVGGTVQLAFDTIFPTPNSKILNVKFKHIKKFVPELKSTDIISIKVEDK